MLPTAALGAVVAGTYGAAHDQLSYAIAPEYFTKMKFRQFAYADLGLHPRLFAAEVGFLGTWWVGLLAGWFVARAGLADLPAGDRRRATARAFGIVVAAAAVGGAAGAACGLAAGPEGWAELRALDIDDPRGFDVVAHLHAGGYAGAAAGAVLAVLYARRCATRNRSAARPSV